jgi:sigma-E factor negative regulatory protein RseB
MPASAAWSSAGIVYTLVGSGTEDDLDDVVAAWPQTAHHPGLVRRLTRGLARIGSWLNPFG